MYKKGFNIRVYGIWINESNQILLSDERIGDFEFTKFPGGGMEYGEGTIDCLKREWIEEMNTPIEVLKHFYTTDFYQPSAFHSDTQIISIYYFIKPITYHSIDFKFIPKDYNYVGHEEVHFRLKNLNELNEDDLDLPIDKIVAKLLKLNV
jgi:8-oxo-dGTP diphosphatase